MFSIEMLKVFKRKFNYIYSLFLVILVLFSTYKSQTIQNYLNISEEQYIYNYFYKYLMLLVAVIVVVNFVISYREDYKSRVVVLINKIKYSNVKNLLSKILANYILAILLFVVSSATLILYSIYIQKKSINVILPLELGQQFFIGILLAMLLLVISVTLFIISIFNDTNIAISLVLLIFLGSKFLVSYLSEINSLFGNLKYSFLDIFNKSFVLEQPITTNEFLQYFLIIIANVILLFMLALILKIFKRK